MNFLTNLISGLSLGSVYAIIALGYTMVYGISKMLNFAHGDIIMIGGYVSFVLTMYVGMNGWVALLVAMVVCTLLGILIERLAYRPLRGTGSLAVLITAIGVSYFLQNSALLIWGANPRVFPRLCEGINTIHAAGGKLTIAPVSLFTILANILIMIVLTLFVNRTKAGKAMRAVSEDNGAAQLMGINVNQETFRSDAPNPVSLINVLGHETELRPLLRQITERFAMEYDCLRDDKEFIRSRYLQHLWRLEGKHPYRDKDGEFMAEVVRVENDGHLVLRDAQGRERSYAFGEVDAVL